MTTPIKNLINGFKKNDGVQMITEDKDSEFEDVK